MSTSTSQSSPVVLPSPPSEMEAKYYYGVPQRPSSSPLRMIARSSTTPWEMPADPKDSRKGLRPVGNHVLNEAWEGLAPKIFDVLRSMNVRWTSIDIVRIGNDDQFRNRTAPVVVWIGIKPDSLSGHDGVKAVFKCKEILLEHNIDDVDVEIRETIVWGTLAALEELYGNE